MTEKWGSPQRARPLSRALQQEAARRGLWQDHWPDPPGLTPEQAFELVREMPYGRTSTHDPGGILREWRGTCSSKHELLQALLSELGLESEIMACTQQIAPPPGGDPQRLGAQLLDTQLLALMDGQPVVDVYNYLRVRTPQGEMDVDATWPLSAGVAGFIVNPQWVWGQDMRVACEPLECWTVPPGETVSGFKERLLRERYTPEQLERRERYILRVGELFLQGLETTEG